MRLHMNRMLRIEKDKDMVRSHDEIFATGTALHRQMEAYEDGDERNAPYMDPMRIDWRNLRGRWNKKIFEHFKEYAEEEGYLGGQLSKDDENELEDIFFRRLTTLQQLINRARPRDGETMDIAQERASQRYTETMANNRKNARRKEVGSPVLNANR